MPKQYTFPDLYDEAKQINISNLKSWGYIKPNVTSKGVLTWSRGEVQRGAISFRVIMGERSGRIYFSYNYGGDPVDYSAEIISIPSNLGSGLIWLFVCPSTGKRCRKLYGVGKYFLHRDAYGQSMYESQTYSKQSRAMLKAAKLMLGTEKRNFRKYYGGKPTKRYQRYLQQQRRLSQLIINKETILFQ